MKLPFHLAVNYAHLHDAEVENALDEFFGQQKPPEELIETIGPIFAEWLIFDFKTKSGLSFLSQYILKNPDNLSDQILDQLTQVAQTHKFSQFQILKLERGNWVEVEDIFSGKIYRVFDEAGTQDSPDHGLLHARVGQIDKKWSFVGANPLLTPIHLTDRAKKVIQTQFKNRSFSIKDTAKMIMEKHQDPPISIPIPKPITLKQLQKKRKILEQQYLLQAKKYNTLLKFDELIEDVYRENDKDVVNFWQSLTKKGVPQDFFLNQVQLFQDIWNYFPHQCLNNKSPVEVFNELKS